MSYNLDDIELMISNLPLHGKVQSLDQRFSPQRRHIKANAWHLPFHTRPRKIVNCLIQYFQRNLSDIENKSWINSELPFFVWDVRKFSEDKDVKKLIQIPNIEHLRSG
uniref:Uncharacterized protein n=1 Tax=uncultured marine crenarchaeote HF4000_APKG6D9 TaxID=455597 RepID=B3T948_9ARCH|nr:hypothetical protein ALOHA_HF4000APKG6D9ctg2g12 [uncultured marine crenarchaeote HF4000_APKG6D9]